MSSPPTRRVIEVLTALGDGKARTASELAHGLGISGSTVALVLAELDVAKFVTRDEEKRYALGPGLLPLLRGVRTRYPLLGVATGALAELTASTGCPCSATRIGADHLEVIAASDGEAGGRFPLDPPYGATVYGHRSNGEVRTWLAGTPARDRKRWDSVLRQVRERGVTCWGVEGAPEATDEVLALLDGVVTADGGVDLREQVSRLFARLGGKGYTEAEVDGEGSFPLSYVLAAVRDPAGVPRYQIELHVLRGSVDAAGRRALVARTREAAELLETTLAVGQSAGPSARSAFARRAPR